tara:strand:- start:901 stop:1074 length:174 start_codon:yes stop_codon:yes gene_type:complete
MRHTEPDGEVWYAFHEKHGPGYTVKPVSSSYESVEDAEWALEAMKSDIIKHGVEDYK